MKKIILTGAAIFMFGYVNAQNKGEDQSVKFGVKAGLNNTNFTGDGDTDAKVSFYIGALVDLTVTEKFHVQPELLFSDEGADDDLGISYLRVPIMAKFYVVDGFSIQAGPEVAFKIGTEEEFFDENSKSVDFGLGFGVAYELLSGLFFDARYNLGLSDISEDDGSDMKNTGAQVGVGFRF